MKTKEYLIKNFIPIAKEEAKGFSDVIECLESIEHYLNIQMDAEVKPACGLCKDCKHFEYSQDYNNVGDCRHPKFSEGIMFQYCDDMYVSEDFGCINFENKAV